MHVNPPSFVRSLRHFGMAENLRSNLSWGLASLQDSHRNRVSRPVLPVQLYVLTQWLVIYVISSFRVEPIESCSSRSCSVFPSTLIYIYMGQCFLFPGGNRVVARCSRAYLFPCHTICVGKSIAS